MIIRSRNTNDPLYSTVVFGHHVEGIGHALKIMDEYNHLIAIMYHDDAILEIK